MKLPRRTFIAATLSAPLVSIGAHISASPAEFDCCSEFSRFLSTLPIDHHVNKVSLLNFAEVKTSMTAQVGLNWSAGTRKMVFSSNAPNRREAFAQLTKQTHDRFSQLPGLYQL